ncbi:hypothetical protein RSAG8_05198, partial [Rhizoctonia solani AG-8 WAC10335]
MGRPSPTIHSPISLQLGSVSPQAVAARPMADAQVSDVGSVAQYSYRPRPIRGGITQGAENWPNNNR